MFQQQLSHDSDVSLEVIRSSSHYRNRARLLIEEKRGRRIGVSGTQREFVDRYGLTGATRIVRNPDRVNDSDTEIPEIPLIFSTVNER